MSSKYDVIPLMGLVRGIQDRAVELMDKDFKKKAGPARLARYHTELNEMRRSAIHRLGQVDRNVPSFFPAGAYVVYQKRVLQNNAIDDFDNYQPDSPEYFGRVVEPAGDLVLVQFEGQEHYVKVEPQYLKLRFIRQ